MDPLCSSDNILFPLTFLHNQPHHQTSYHSPYIFLVNFPSYYPLFSTLPTDSLATSSISDGFLTDTSLPTYVLSFFHRRAISKLRLHREIAVCVAMVYGCC
jgi:hypothetical protein